MARPFGAVGTGDQAAVGFGDDPLLAGGTAAAEITGIQAQGTMAVTGGYPPGPGSPGVVPSSAALHEIYLQLETWYPGGAATANVLLGRDDPAGRLPVTWPAWARRLRGSQPTGIFVGYRRYDEDGIAPLFPFGYGISYTRFGYSALNWHAVPGRGLVLRFRVTNTGGRAGDGGATGLSGRAGHRATRRGVRPAGAGRLHQDQPAARPVPCRHADRAAAAASVLAGRAWLGHRARQAPAVRGGRLANQRADRDRDHPALTPGQRARSAASRAIPPAQSEICASGR